MTEREYKNITYVDENNNLLGTCSYDEALEKNYIRQAARVFVFNENGKILIQKRSRHISKPLLLDQSAAGHVDEGETYEQAAKRELKEEIGISDVTLETVVENYRETSFFSTVYRTKVTNNIEITYDPYEIDSVMWLTPTEVDKIVNQEPERCSPSLVKIWTELRDKLIS